MLDNRNVVQLPGKRAETNILYRIRDAARFTGELYHIAGSKNDVKVRISTTTHGAVFCKTTRDIGKSLRDFLFKDVSVSGRGLWTRTANGEWSVEDFVITDFAPISKDSLRNSIKRIRAMDISWPDDPLNTIKEIEENNEKPH